MVQGNSTQEYYHPTQYEPQPARLAHVMRSMLGLRSGSGPECRKQEVTQRLNEKDPSLLC